MAAAPFSSSRRPRPRNIEPTDEADFTLPNGRRVLRTANFTSALVALNEAPDARVSVTVTFRRMAGISGVPGTEISHDDHSHQLLTTIHDTGWRSDPAATFIDAAIDHGGDLAAAATHLACRGTVIDDLNGRTEWYVHTAENPHFIRINWELPARR